MYSDQHPLGYGNDGAIFNLKDEGIEIEKIFINDGFAEYQHDIGILSMINEVIYNFEMLF